MSNPVVDQNLLFGLLALQNGIITREALVAAFSIWLLDKTRLLDEILVEKRALSPDRQSQLKQMMIWHIKIHDQDPAQSLAAVSSASAACQLLAGLGDQDIQASLKHVMPATPSVDPSATVIGADPHVTVAFTNASSTGNKIRFQSLRPHAKGGLGEVSVALDKELHREVALKEIQPQFAGHQASRERFVLEAEITGALEHPGIVPVYGLGTYPDGRPFYAMRFIKGDSLKEALEQFHNTETKAKQSAGERQLQLRKLLGRFSDVCNAIEYAHSRGVLHRDLKPGNIMLGRYGETLVVDWGLAKSVGKKDVASVEATFHPTNPLSSSGMTISGQAIGTPAYMSPEQATGRLDIIGPASDIYSLGATLYHILTGRPPIADSDVRKVLQRVQQGDILSPRKCDPTIPRPLEAICLKAMALKPEERYPSARAIIDDVEHWLADEPVTARTETAFERLARFARKHRGYVRAGVSSVIIVALISIVAAFLIESARRKAIDLAHEKGELARKNARLADDKTNLANLEKSAREAADLNADAATKQTKLAKRHLYAAHMNLAQLAWEAARVGETVRLLELYLPTGRTKDDSDDLRGFEWHYWNRLCRSPLLELKKSGQTISFAISSDGRRIASASDDYSITVWDATNGREVLGLKGHNNLVGALAFSPDVRRIASASRDNTVRIWDAISGREQLTLKGHAGWVESVVFSPDGLRLASASRDKTIKIWNAENGAELLILKGHSDGVLSLAYSPDGNRLVSAGLDSDVRFWDVTSGHETLRLKGHTKPIISVAFSSDGKHVASASEDQRVTVWNALTGKPIHILKGHTHWVKGVAFSPDGGQLATASADQTVRLWNVVTGDVTNSFRGHASYVLGVAFGRDHRRLASVGLDGVKLWDTTFNQEVVKVTGHNSEVMSVVFSPDAKRLASASSDQTVKIWDTASFQEILTLKGHSGQVTSVTFSPDGRRLASASSDQTAKIWDAHGGVELLTLKGHSSWVTGVTFGWDGKRLASASGDHTVKIWETASGQELLTLKGHSAWVTSVAFNSAGEQLASGSHDQTVKLWDATTGQEVLTLKGHNGAVKSVVFSTDGKRLASAGTDNSVKLWDVESGKELLSLKGHTSQVTDLMFSPDGRRLISASTDQTVKVWDSATGLETLTLKGHTGPVWGVAFSSDGTRAASAGGSSDHTTIIWDARPWTPELRSEREALNLIHFLRDQGKPQSEWPATITADQTISEPVRQRALQFAREWK